MALEDREEFDAIARHPVDDPVGALEYLAPVVATKLRNLPARHGCARRALCSDHELANPPLRGTGIVSSDEVADRLEIGERPVRPDDSQRFV